MLKAIVASSPEGIIAIDGEMPWNVPEDLQHFKRHTLNHVVIMGRKTWESLGKKCLPNRVNFVVSRNGTFSHIADTCAVMYSSIDAAINDAALKYPDKDVWIIGGAEIYRQTLPIVDELYLTIINKDKVCYHEGERKYLPGFMDKIVSLFKLRSVDRTDNAEYKIYKRRISGISDKISSYTEKT